MLGITGDDIADAGLHQNLAEGAAGACHQGDHARRVEGLVRHVPQVVSREAAPDAEEINRQHADYHQRPKGMADQRHDLTRRVPLREKEIAARAADHQKQRQHEYQQHGDKARLFHMLSDRSLFFHFLLQLRIHVLWHLDINPFPEEASIEHAANQHGRDCRCQAEENYHAHVRAQADHSGHSPRRRRDGGIGNHHACQEGNRVVQKAALSGLGEAVNDGRKHNKAHFNIDGDGDQDSDKAQGPDNIPLPCLPVQGIRQILDAAGNLHDLAEHGADGDNHGQKSQGASHSLFDGFKHKGRRHAKGQTRHDAHDQKRQHLMYFQFQNQKQQ